MNPSQVFLRPTDPNDPEAPWEALLQMADGSVQILPPEGLDGLAERIRAGRLIVLVPGARVLLTRVEMPTRNSRAMMKALPYALEDLLADEVESLHFVPGARDPDGRLRVAVVSRGDMQSWLEALRAQGLEPHLLVPETAVLPTPPDTWTVRLEGSMAWLATADGDGAAMERDNAAFLLQLQWDETPPDRRPERLEIHRHGPALPGDEALDRLDQTFGAEVRCHAADERLLVAIVGEWPKSVPFNLACGAFGPRDGLGQWWRPWRPAAILLLALVVVQFITLGWELHTLQAEQDRLDREITQVFERTFPGSRVVDPRRQMQSALNSLQQGQGGGPATSGLDALLTVAGPALAAEQGLTIQSLRYQPGRLDLDLHLADLRSLDRLRQQLESTVGWSVEIQSASTREDRVDSRILIRSNDS
ncbi:type II secretion system protein GspL [Ectothiorhodospira lacustris]|uniref:type II secretion system protein GspL n=1 Tax=Ectothiorhodospira lacustris TaxID=2899127 RepID=UPI001EE8000A|nr:type II secretion system protein GspL [Ectothiorhodospira lacustris]MCG5509040.1 type II secretion system protein GspL [Ectothiorhodospira lacustris]MCG5520831.1 type II secretion system protein GspL [Ectothiorhodospira lacustris]